MDNHYMFSKSSSDYMVSEYRSWESAGRSSSWNALSFLDGAWLSSSITVTMCMSSWEGLQLKLRDLSLGIPGIL